MVDEIPAILEAWLPGEEGGNAIADVVFGDFNPGGKLPISFPRHVGQVPVFYAHRPSGGRSHWQEHYVDTNVKPQYPFGFGLSYTTFEFDNLQIGASEAQAGETVEISVTVKNVGSLVGDEVVQLYTHNFAVGMSRPVKELRGFKRVTLAPGEKATVTFMLAVNQLGFYNRERQFVVQPGTVDVMVGNSSDNPPCTGSFEVIGSETDVSASKAYFSEVRVTR